MLNMKRIGEGTTTILFNQLFTKFEVKQEVIRIIALLNEHFIVEKVEIKTLYKKDCEGDKRCEVHIVLDGQWICNDDWVEIGDCEFFVAIIKY